MRTISFFSVLLLCTAILIIDILAFYWLQDITNLLNSSILQQLVHVIFWVFTVGLISAIIILKARLDDINPRRKQLWISRFYGLAVSSFIPKIIFVIIISILHFTNFVFLEEESLVIVPLIGLFSGVLPFSVIVYGIFRAAYRYKVYHLKLNLDKLPKVFNGIRIVQISDIHLGSFNFRYKTLQPAIRIINNLKPDIIVFTGDIVNNFSWELEGWDQVFDKLKSKYGKYAVLGNHDYGDYSSWDTEADKLRNQTEIAEFFEKIGFQLLKNESVQVKKNGSAIGIIGVENWGNPPFKQYGDLNKALQGTETNQLKILLSHDPTHWKEEVHKQTDIELTLSGHTHGMQAGIQSKRFNWSPIKYKYEHWGGLYELDNQFLYVNRGLGWIGFPGRLGMRPEITEITLWST